jgi:hypothetical protein
MEDGALFRPTGNIGRRTVTADGTYKPVRYYLQFFSKMWASSH